MEGTKQREGCVTHSIPYSSFSFFKCIVNIKEDKLRKELDDLRKENDELRKEIRRENDELRKEIRRENDESRKEMDEIRKENEALRKEMDEIRKERTKEIESRKEVSKGSEKTPKEPILNNKKNKKPSKRKIFEERIRELSLEKGINEDMILCWAMLSTIIEDERSGAYIQEVNPIEYPILDYFQKIEKPMDLTTVYRKIVNGIYNDKNEFKEDMYLIFNNAMKYNSEEYDIHKNAKALMIEFKKFIHNKKEPKLNLTELISFNSPCVIKPLFEHTPYYEDEAELKQLESDYYSLKNNTVNESEMPLTVKQKEDICNIISKCSSSKVEEYLKVQELQAFNNETNGVIEIDMNKMSDENIRKLEKIGNGTYSEPIFTPKQTEQIIE